MRAAAKQLEFERAAALRDEIQQIRLRVLQEDASIRVGRAAERARPGTASDGARPDRRGRPGARRVAAATAAALAAGPSMEVTSVDGPARRRGAGATTLDGEHRASTRTPSPTGCRGSATSTRTTAAGRPAGSTGRPGTGPSRRTSASAPASARDAAGTRRRISRTAKPRHTPGVRRCPALAALLVVGIVASGCSAERAATAVGDHGGLDLQLELSSTNGVLAARTVVRNTRAHPISLDADQCGRGRRRRHRPHDVRAGRRDADGVRRRGEEERPRRSAILARIRSGSRREPSAAPRSPGANARTSRCRWQPAHPSKNAESCRSAHRVAWPRSGPRTRSSGPQAVEAVAPDRITFLDSLPTGATEEQRAGRSVTVEIPTSSVLERAPTRPNVGPSLGQVFDRIVENNRLRAFIEAQPPGSWRDAGLRVAEHGSGLLFRAVTTMFERPATATITVDGSDVGDLVLPGDADRARVFDRRPATLPPGITVIPDQSGAEISEDVVAGRLALPSGQLVADGSLAGGSEPLPYAAAAGSYTAFVTLVRYPGSSAESVALATVVVSDAPTVGWKRGYTVAVDGGTAAFTPVEGSDALGQMIRADQSDWVVFQQAAFDSLTAHDNLITDHGIPGGLNLVMFSTGLGDGQYPVRVGLDAEGHPTRYVLDCLLLHLAWPDE